MSPRQGPVSRRSRPAKAPLSRESVVATALRLMKDEGLERVTMRRLGTELETGPASLYVYVRNTAELHGALLDELLAELLAGVDRPAPGQPWRERLISLLSAYTELLFAYPSLARSVLTLRPSGPNYLRLIDTVLGLLHAGGVPAGQAAWGVDLLLQHATATAAEHGSRAEAAEAEREAEDLAMAVADAPADAYPHIAMARQELFAGTGGQRQRWALSAIIEGLRVPIP
ncbi:TetR/AcrR family transcriptional regulator C-terminal domain-containing protein [Dactylosporangium sp. NPDC006015]|uniref:TetR/AcrR family transcriptional regulator n=1 Tax=Dactylosporangium sp. NPDC006015 TaxID=3154576 RepID=UPI0033B90F01